MTGARRRRARRILRSRLWPASALLMLLGGPAPGAVGSCGGDRLEKPADLQSYCSQREQLVCVRRSLRKELSAKETDDCRRAALARCESRFWSPECQPTERQARACINALESFDTLETKENELHECSLSVLCGLPAPMPAALSGTAGAPSEEP